MDIKKELKNIAAKKEGNKEMAFFCDSFQEGFEDDVQNWRFYLGNSIGWMILGGENEGDLTTSGDSLEEVIYKMKRKLGI